MSNQAQLFNRQWVLRFGQLLPYLLLLPILTFPAGPDQSIYGISGKMLMQGMTYYTQVGDLKPPFIHFVYGISNALLGDGIIAPRVVELLVQWVTLFFIVKLTCRYVAASWTSTIAASIYALLYVGLGADGTGQPENYIGCLLLPGILLLLNKPTPMRLVGAGVIASLLALVKYSMLICPVLFILMPFLLPFQGVFRWKESMRSALFIALGAIPPLLIAYWYLYHSEAIVGFLQANQFLSSRMKLVLQQGGIGERMESLGRWLGYSFGLTMAGFLSLGMWNAITTLQSNKVIDPVITVDTRFYRCIVLIVATLFLSTVVELLMFPYQFSRMYAPAAIVIAIVISQHQIINRLLLTSRQKGIALKLILCCLVLVGFMFSPLPRFFLETARGIAWRSSAEVVNNQWFHVDSPVLRDITEVGDTIRLRAAEEPTTLVAISGFAGYLYCYTNTTPTYRQLHGHLLIAPFTPVEWKQELVDYIQQHKPQFIAVERNDEQSAKFAGAIRTDSAIAAIPMMTQLLQQHYDTVLALHSIVLYQSSADSTKK